MSNYVISSLELHLFFGRIMKEHALFLLAGFPEKETGYRKRADHFREEFERLLEETVEIANGRVGENILQSGEIITRFTLTAERQTQRLSGIPINSRITQAEERLRAGCECGADRGQMQQIRRLNRRAIELLNGLIAFKEEILREVNSCRLYTTNYPLLIEHILREARLYRQFLMNLERNGRIAHQDMRTAEIFWNQIMMEHAQFIRGLLDPTECELIEAADGFARDYCRLLEEAKKQDSRVQDTLVKETLKTTEKYRDFKAAGTAGITECEIRSIILPLLADHVLREANHYLRILEMS
ncbi:MAG TPA: DUF2935 domain-containing protein [Candidatus Mediterraneibacter merdavium]|nr:DUF2935 domain-containing protein [Candidatus Mediterraneibacter merdavium]